MSSYIDPIFLEAIRTEYNAEPSASERRRVVLRYAEALGVSDKTLYRKLDLNRIRTEPRKQRTTSAEVEARRLEIDRYSKIIFDYANEHTFDHARCTMRTAFRHLQRTQQIPAWLTEQQAYKSIDRQHLVELASPIAKTFDREHPLDLIQADFTVSRYIKHIGNERLVVVKPNATKMTKSRVRLWCGVAVDDCSRVYHMQYFLAPGEKAHYAQQFLMNVFGRKPERRDFPNDFLLQGLPKELYVDRGSGWVAGSTQAGLARMGIKCILGANERDSRGYDTGRSNKKARGKVEKAVWTLKNVFEAGFAQELGYGTELSVGELNVALWRWLEEWNQCEHPKRKGEGKWNIFSKALASAEYPESNTLRLFVKPMMRKVIDRLINVGSNTYCVAPVFIPDGAEVEIIESHNFHYVFWEGTRHSLEYQVGTPAELRKKGEISRMRIEHDSDVLEGTLVNDRFEEELIALTEGTLRVQNIPLPMWNNIENFFEQSQSVAAIKELAKVTVMRCASLVSQSKIIYSKFEEAA